MEYAQDQSRRPLQHDQVVALKKSKAIQEQMATLPDAFSAWIDLYLALVMPFTSRFLRKEGEGVLTLFPPKIPAKRSHCSRAKTAKEVGEA